MSDDELFGNGNDLEIEEDVLNPNEGIENKQTQEDSDLDSEDIYFDNDFFGKTNITFQKTTPFSIIEPPTNGPIQNFSL